MKHMKHNDAEAVFDADVFGVNIDDRGHVRGFAHNKFVKSFLKIYPIAYDAKSKVFYIYDKCGVWRKTGINDIKRDMLKILDTIHPDIWNTRREKEIENTLSLRCFSTGDLKDASEYINVKNGLLSLKTFKLKKHRKSIFSTRQLPIEYNTDATAPNWNRFLIDIFLGDKELRKLLQEITGYILSSKTEAQKFFFIYSTGSSGKSVYTKMVTMLVGGEEYVSSVTLSKLNDKFARAQLQGAAVNISTENEIRQFSTETVKALSSGDLVQIEHKQQDATSQVITAKLVFCLNNQPIPKDKTYAIYRRLIIVPFLACFTPNPDPNKENELPIKTDILSELTPELEGILAWAIRGLKRLIKNDYHFTNAEKSNQLLREYRADVDVIFDFMQEAIKAKAESKISYDSIYKAFDRWRKMNNVNMSGVYHNQSFHRMLLKEIRQHLDQEHIKYGKSHSGTTNYLIGIKLKKSFKEKYLSL